MITYYIKPLIVESICELEFREVFFHKLKPFGVLASMEMVKESNVCPAEKRTKHSSNILLRLVHFSVGQTLRPTSF